MSAPVDRATSAPRRAVVIGGGIAGLASAALLARDGYEVDLLEKNDSLGGRAGSWEKDGFRFDTGPSWYLMPEVFDRFFRLLGTSAAEQLELAVLDPGYRVFFEGDDESLDVRPDRAANVELFESVEPGAGAALERYLESARRTYELAVRRFLYSSFDSPRDLLHRDVLLRAPRLAELLLRPLSSFIASRFRDRRLRQILGYPAVFLGSSPDRAPSMYHLMSHMDLADAVRYPQGGFTGLVEVVADLARREGARLHTSATVTAITTAPDESPGRPPRARRARATGVRWLDSSGAQHSLEADVVVAAADLHHVETKLLPEPLRTYPQRWWDRRTSGPGAVLVNLGVRGRLPELAHHSLFFTRDWRSNFDAIFGPEPTVPAPASIYVCKPSETDPTVAPRGHENLFVLVPVPADVRIGRGGPDGSGDDVVEQVADAAIDQIASWAGVPDLRERVVVRRTVGPADFATELNSWSGGMLGPAHTLRQSAFLRGSNASRRVSGLVYAGASTIPGVGLPMCLISAEIAVERVRRESARSAHEAPAPAHAHSVAVSQ